MGLLYPSRKQYDSFTPRTGEYIKTTEKKTIHCINSTATADATIITVPSGKKLSILQLAFYTTAPANRIYFVKLDGVAVHVSFIPASTDVVGSDKWTYEEAPTAYSTVTLDVQGGGNLTSNDLSVIYALEDAGGGYFTN